MFDSGLSVALLLEQIKNEADIAIPIEDKQYISWLNALEQLLYTEIIREQGKIELEPPQGSVVTIDTLNVPNGENAIRFEDIHAIYADGTQLIRSSVASGVIFSDSYYKIGNNIGLNLKKTPEKIIIVYFVKPELKTEEYTEQKNVMLPLEFIDLAKAKLRGEAYKVANEGELAAMWINDYNVLLENFKAWISGKKPEFGL